MYLIHIHYKVPLWIDISILVGNSIATETVLFVIATCANNLRNQVLEIQTYCTDASLRRGCLFDPCCI